MIFECIKKTSKGIEKWPGHITKLVNYGSHYEMRIESRSGITVFFGKTSFGNFACIPDFGAGCHLADFKDEFYSTEKLTYVMNSIDGITVAKALTIVPDILKKRDDKNHEF